MHYLQHERYIYIGIYSPVPVPLWRRTVQLVKWVLSFCTRMRQLPPRFYGGGLVAQLCFNIVRKWRYQCSLMKDFNQFLVPSL